MFNLVISLGILFKLSMPRLFSFSFFCCVRFKFLPSFQLYQTTKILSQFHHRVFSYIAFPQMPFYHIITTTQSFIPLSHHSYIYIYTTFSTPYTYLYHFNIIHVPIPHFQHHTVIYTALTSLTHFQHHTVIYTTLTSFKSPYHLFNTTQSYTTQISHPDY